jgi:hypothetical protein
MNVVEKKKFEKEFMEDLIIYIEYQDIKEKESNKITEEEFFKL